MKNLIIFGTLTIFGIFLLTPQTTLAYLSSSQKVSNISSTTALYAIEFSFGHDKHDTYIPVLAVRDQVWGEAKKTLGFEVLTDDARSASSSAFGIVLGGKNVTKDMMYFVPKGEVDTFTFYVLLNNTTDETDDYAVRVTDLPFYWDDARTHLKLNPSELQYYTTPEAEIGK